MLPTKVEVAIVGGGVAGCSLAYHLTKIGVTDVALFERKQLTSGTTWHAAGLVTQLRPTRRMTELAQYTGELFAGLEAETGQATGFKQNGALRAAKTEQRFEELKRSVAMARSFGLEAKVLDRDELAEYWSHLNTDDLVGGVWMPKDGQVNPADVTMALAKGARMGGARIFENTKVEKILVSDGRAVGIRTPEGDIQAKTVVICGGMWSREIAGDIGVALPLHAAEHFYIVTEAIEGLARNLPVLFVHDEHAYYKEDAGKLLLGCFEPKAKPWGHHGISPEFCFDSLPEDFDHFEPILAAAAERVPLLQSAGIQLFFNGPESFTPDGRYLMGETSEIDGLFCACGFNSIGILSSGGVGKALADWIKNGRPPFELIDVDVRRTQSFQVNSSYLFDRTTETLGLNFAMHWPNLQMTTSRGLRRSPFHDRLAAQGAFMTEAAGYERPGFFGTPGETPKIEYSWRRQNWHENVAREVENTEKNVSLFDQSCFVKLIVEGRDALSQLSKLCAADIDVPLGKVVYTQWLNEAGGIEADLTVTRLGEHRFMVVTIAASQSRDMAWLRRHIDMTAHVFVQDVTSGMAMLSLMGPKSRALLEKLSKADLSNEAFPFATSREIELGMAMVRATRVTFVGELGWELYMPTEVAQYCFDKLVEAGAEFGLGHAGFFTMNSMRMEKGYRHWGHDIGVEDTPLDAGLGFAVSWEKQGGFIGRDALLRQRESGLLKRRLVQLKLDAPIEQILYHDEPIWSGGTIVGSVTSGAYGHRVKSELGMGYIRHAEGVTPAVLQACSFEIEIATRRYPATAQLAPWFDPKGLRIKN